MKLIEFLFAIIRQFVPISQVRIDQLERQASDWEKNLVVDETSEKPADKLKLQFKQYGEHWAFQVFMAIFYIFAVRYVADFMRGGNDQEEE